MKNPYTRLPMEAFWRSAVADVNAHDIKNLWNPKYFLGPAYKIATFGSCFAQHFARSIRAKGYTWIDAEPPPSLFNPKVCEQYNYGIFSARTGNIYTARALKQWVYWASGLAQPPAEVWEKDGRYFDPFRPAIEPGGFLSVEELVRSRNRTLASIAQIMATAHVFVFTLGLTESWVNRIDQYEYAMCPGTHAGQFDEQSHIFINHSFNDILRDLKDAMDVIRRVNNNIKFLLTVSPVPLTATASREHVLVATTFSKAVLRAVAGQMAQQIPAVDYFPSYEIISSPPMGGMFFEPNKRSVSQAGVDHVMRLFFAGLERKFGAPKGAKPIVAQPPGRPAIRPSATKGDVVCEEEMLSVFGPNVRSAQ